jgi:hypothetical protein
MLIDDNYIISYFFKNEKYLYKKLLNIEDNIYIYLKNRYIDSLSLKETIFRIKYNIEQRPVCPICGNNVKFIGNNNIIFRTCCCIKCSNLNNYNKISKIKEERYGDKYYSNREKAKRTLLERYGEDYNKIIGKKISDSLNNRTSEEKKLHRENIKNTLLLKYNIENPGQLSDHNEKIQISKILKNKKNNNLSNISTGSNKDTCLIKYNEDNVSKVDFIKEKRVNTNIKKYGVQNIWNLDKYKEKAHSEESKLKIIETNRKRYNCDNALQNEDIKLKSINTKKTNKSFNTSKPEEETYILLKKKYPDVIRQYGNKLYPFNCDFYIPSLDLYIECQYSIFHNKRPYLGTDEDLKEVEILNKKAEDRKKILNINKSQYDAIIYTWTDLDVRKRNIAKENNLNFIEFWSVHELKKWLK